MSDGISLRTLDPLSAKIRVELLQDSVEVVGVEDEPDGSIRVYLNTRSRGVFAVVDDPEAITMIRREWANPRVRLLIPRPPDNAIGQDRP